MNGHGGNDEELERALAAIRARRQQAGGGGGGGDDEEMERALQQARSRKAEAEPGFIKHAGRDLAATGQNVLGIIPGWNDFVAPAINAGVSTVGSKLFPGKVEPQTFEQARQGIQQEIGRIPTPIRIGQQIAAGIASGGTGLIPVAEKQVAANAPILAKLADLGRRTAVNAKTGAGISALYPLASADPNESALDRIERAGKAALTGAGISAALTPAVEGINAGVQWAGQTAPGRFIRNLASSMRSRTPGAIREDYRTAQRNTAAREYGAVDADVAASAGTNVRVREMVNDPKIAPLVDEVRASFRIQKKPVNDAQVLLQVLRELSDDEGALLKAANPQGRQTGVKVRLKMRERQDVAAIKEEIVQALSKPSEKPPIMFDVPAQRTEQVLDPGRPTVRGPRSRGRPAQVFPEHETITGPIMEGTAGRARGEQAQVSLSPSGEATAVSPRDVQGPAGPAFMLRGQAPQVAAPETPGSSFTLQAQPRRVVTTETPAMRVQTAPAEAEPPLAPTLARAQQAHAERAQDIRTFQTWLAHGRRLANAERIPHDLLEKQSPEAVERLLNELTPHERTIARSALEAAAKESLRLPRLNPNMSMLGLIQELAKPTQTVRRLGPFLEQVDRLSGYGKPQAPLTADDLRRLLGLTGLMTGQSSRP